MLRGNAAAIALRIELCYTMIKLVIELQSVIDKRKEESNAIS